MNLRFVGFLAEGEFPGRCGPLKESKAIVESPGLQNSFLVTIDAWKGFRLLLLSPQQVFRAKIKRRLVSSQSDRTGTRKEAARMGFDLKGYG